jgi:hypothetical protein
MCARNTSHNLQNPYEKRKSDVISKGDAVVERDVDCGNFKSPLALVLEFPRKEALQQSIQRSACGVHRRPLRRFATALWGRPPRVENVRTQHVAQSSKPL